jgi:hypothetical protein
MDYPSDIEPSLWRISNKADLKVGERYLCYAVGGGWMILTWTDNNWYLLGSDRFYLHGSDRLLLQDSVLSVFHISTEEK